MSALIEGRVAPLPNPQDLHELEHAFARTLSFARRSQAATLATPGSVESLLDELIELLFPRDSSRQTETEEQICARLIMLGADLERLLSAFAATERSGELAGQLTRTLPGIYEMLQADDAAILAGDPAAESLDEVLIAYPGFQAIAVHRLAHALCGLGVPILPRLLAEVAHSRTGIDIHPGATIGRSFCIDHGTGIVIGETTKIGEAVKLYQGVTLGAHSVATSSAGKKRHPTIEDRVVIYANATVLGGDTIIGHDSVIGGNVWLTTSVPPGSFVYHRSQISVRRVADTLHASDYSI